MFLFKGYIVKIEKRTFQCLPLFISFLFYFAYVTFVEFFLFLLSPSFLITNITTITVSTINISLFLFFFSCRHSAQAAVAALRIPPGNTVWQQQRSTSTTNRAVQTHT